MTVSSSLAAAAGAGAGAPTLPLDLSTETGSVSSLEKRVEDYVLERFKDAPSIDVACARVQSDLAKFTISSPENDQVSVYKIALEKMLIIKAVTRRDVSQVKALLKENNYRFHGEALAAAAAYGYEDIIEILLCKGDKTELLEGPHKTLEEEMMFKAMHFALSHDSTVCGTLRRSIDVNDIWKKHFMKAVFYGDIITVEALLKLPIVLEELADKEGGSFFANVLCEFYHTTINSIENPSPQFLEALQALIRLSGEIPGLPPFDIDVRLANACERGCHIDIIRVLISHHELDLNTDKDVVITSSSGVLVLNMGPHAAFRHAYEKGRRDVVDLLKQAGVPEDAFDKYLIDVLKLKRRLFDTPHCVRSLAKEGVLIQRSKEAFDAYMALDTVMKAKIIKQLSSLPIQNSEERAHILVRSSFTERAPAIFLWLKENLDSDVV